MKHIPINKDNLHDFMSQQYHMYASQNTSTSAKALIYNGYGQIKVMHNGEVKYFGNSPSDACKIYNNIEI